ncbi:DUF3718 domain-containing protein [uncultured Ferrimonas sp.]|uniref:DUF3718 domain-containing protein n=1 Tax=uncultured Ferrimonas sp. TaxID=432640 RepID=UPI002614CFC7|nr:DUF3718 domain-containing protein [uncultured Ferrimonas sp.]
MRAGIVVAALVAAAVTYSPASQANVQQLAANVCDYVQANDKGRLRKRLKESRVKLRNVYPEIQCNGNSLLRFAMSNNADGVGVFVAKQISKNALVAPEADGQTVLDWAAANGYGDGKIASSIGARLN